MGHGTGSLHLQAQEMDKIAVAADNQSFYTAFDEGDRLTAKRVTGQICCRIWELSLED